MRFLFCGILIGLIAHNAHCETNQTFESTTGAYAIELFTSEGCNSCPPAERWLSSHNNHPQLWKTHFPIAWHVDYWDYLGWKDNFASASYANRQRRYAHNDQFNGVYTPGIIVNGQEYRGWRRSRHLTHLIDQLPETLRLQLAVNARSATLSLQLIEAVAGLTPNNQWKSTIAVLGFGVESEISRGENKGKTFQHDFVVLHSQSRSLTPENFKINDEHHTVATFAIDTDTIQRRHNPEKLAVVAFIETDSSPTPVAITGGWLTNEI